MNQTPGLLRLAPPPCPFCASRTGVHPSDCAALDVASKLTLIEYRQHVFALARWNTYQRAAGKTAAADAVEGKA